MKFETVHRSNDQGPLRSLDLTFDDESEKEKVRRILDTYHDRDNVTIEWSDFTMTATKKKWLSLGVFD